MSIHSRLILLLSSLEDMLIKLMVKVMIISICVVDVDFTYTNRKGSMFSAISCMITPWRHMRIGARNYHCNECIFLDFDTLNILFLNLYVVFPKLIYW